MKKLSNYLLVFLMILSVYGCSKNNEIYEKLMEQGVHQIEKEKYERAENFFKKALEGNPKDEKATILIKQTQKMLKALKEYDEGDFEAAKISAEKVKKLKGGSETLQEKAESLLGQMEELEKKKEEYTASYEEAKQHYEQGEFDESLRIVDEFSEEDLSHPFFGHLTENIDMLKSDVKNAREKALAAAEAKAEAEEKAKAEAEERAKVEAEKKAAEKAQQEKVAEEKAKVEAAPEDIGAAGGYWLTEDRTEACHLTPTYFACAVKQSDVGFEENIINIHHISSTEIELTLNSGYKTRLILADKDVLQGEGGRMNRVSKEEANSIYEGYYELP